MPIVRPVGNLRSYILDRDGRQTPILAEGELYVGGIGVGRGYLRDAAQTAKSFVPDPFGIDPGGRLYRTGDKSRYKSDGNIEFLGRLDNQVKIRGNRIELGEIEAALLMHLEVKEAVVMAKQDARGGQNLVGYIVAKEQPGPTVTDLQTHLRHKLPEYMVPMRLMMLEQMPLTANGKLDRRRLPEPEVAAAVEQEAARQTAIEEIISGIWAEVLKVEGVSRQQNFFELGGHSLLATQVISRVREVLAVEVGLRELFEQPTVEGLSEAVERQRQAGAVVTAPAIRRVQRGAETALADAQQRLWFIHQLEPNSAAYNIPHAVRLVGELDIAALRRAMGEVVRRHEVLRARFVSRGGRAVQVVGEDYEIAL